MRMDKGTTKYYIHLYSPKWWSKEEKKYIHTKIYNKQKRKQK